MGASKLFRTISLYKIEKYLEFQPKIIWSFSQVFSISLDAYKHSLLSEMIILAFLKFMYNKYVNQLLFKLSLSILTVFAACKRKSNIFCTCILSWTTTYLPINITLDKILISACFTNDLPPCMA